MAADIKSEWRPASPRNTRPASVGICTGQAFLRQNGGGVVTCAGYEVEVFPATAYTREVAEASNGTARVLLGMEGGNDGRLQALGVNHLATCDAEGNFEVTGLPAGTWIVQAPVYWQVGAYTQGGSP